MSNPASSPAAFDGLLRRVGVGAVNATAARLGLTSTVVESDLRTMLDSIGQDLGRVSSHAPSPARTTQRSRPGTPHAAGSAPLAATGAVMATPGYLAPERVVGTRPRPASDLYALGIVAFECPSGARPTRSAPR